MRKIIASLFLLVGFLAHADDDVKDPHNTGLLSSLNLGIRYSSMLVSRGVILYRDYQIDPVVGAFFFDDRLEFLGDSLSYRDFVIPEQLRLRAKMTSVTDQPLFPAIEQIKNSAPMRPDTYELSAHAELFLGGYHAHYFSEVDLTYAKDVSVHHGNYIEAQTKYKLFDFRLPKAHTKIEPNLYASVGWGDAAHNRYLYGPSADRSGFNNYSYGVWFAFPEEADRYYPIIILKHFSAIGDFRDANFASGRSEGWLFSFIATQGVL